MNVRLAAVLGAGVVLVAGIWLYRGHARSARAASRAAAAVSASVAHGDPLLRVPHTPGAITLDGDNDDPGWIRPPGPAKTQGFLLPNGDQARPYSHARMVWGDGYLYLALFAADEDIESHTDQPDGPLETEDHFRIVLSQPGVEYAIVVSPNAVIADSIRKNGGNWDSSWTSGVHVSKEKDGTINNPNNNDEEWAIEMAIPFESIGMNGERGETIGLSLTRCDTPKRLPRVCAGWGEGADGHPRGRIVLE